MLRGAQAADEEEDRRYGKDGRGDELPEELSFREGRLEKIREAMAALEAEAQAAAERAEAEGKEHPGVPEDKSQRNFTDAESRIMPAPGGRDFVQAYNCQAWTTQVIVAARPPTCRATTTPSADAKHDYRLGVRCRDGRGRAPRGRISRLSPRDRMREATDQAWSSALALFE